MNRVDRLYAIVEELRAVSPRQRTAMWLARRFETSTRTVERDLNALRESGVAIRGGVGRSGGYFLDRERTLPPVTLTAAEAVAISVALRSVGSSPFGSAARIAALKVLAVLPADVRHREQELVARVHTLLDEQVGANSTINDIAAQAVATNRVMHLTYTASDGSVTDRDIEPLGFLCARSGWYLVGWCRLRGAVRGFQLARVAAATLTEEYAPPREVELADELLRIGATPMGN